MKRRFSTLAILLSMSAAPAISAKPCPEAILAELGYGSCNIEQHPIPSFNHAAFLPDGQIIYKKWLGLDAPGTAVKLELLNADGSVSDRPFQFEREDFCQSFSNKKACQFGGASIGSATQILPTKENWLIVSTIGEDTRIFSVRDGQKPVKIGKISLPGEAWPDAFVQLEDGTYSIFSDFADRKRDRMQVISTQISQDGKVIKKPSRKDLILGQFRSIAPLPNGEWIISGLDHRSGGSQSGMIQKINADGTADWSQGFEASDYRSEFKIKTREDGLSVLMGLAEASENSFSDDEYLPFLAATDAAGDVKTQTTLDTEYYGAALDGEWENARQFLVAVGAEYGFVHSYYRLDENMKIIGYSDQSKSTDLGLLADMRSLTDGTLRLTFSDGFEKKLSIVTLKLGAE